MPIEVRGVSKRFGDVQALADVTVTFEEGKIYGLLGNNGAGKSTLMNIIAGRLYPDEGQVRTNGLPADSDGALGQMFLMSEANLFPDDMKVRKALAIARDFYPGYDRAEAEHLAERFGLNTKKKINKLSTGYGSIFKLVLALSVNTPYLLLDEPVLGLDAQHREMFYRLLMEKYAQNHCTVILSTHLIAEAANLVEHAVVIREGRILRDMPVEELTGGAYTVSGPAAQVEAYLEGRSELSRTALGGLLTAAVEGKPDQVPEGLEIARLNLQDYFVGLMEKEDRR